MGQKETKWRKGRKDKLGQSGARSEKLGQDDRKAGLCGATYVHTLFLNIVSGSESFM
jgi:hypothetical protein